MPIRTAQARWVGDFTSGSGMIRTSRGGYEGTYTAASRFEEGPGANPEELVGAAHAACFSQFLAKLLADAGSPPTSIETSAKVHLNRTDAGQTVTRIELDTVGEVSGIEEPEFVSYAENAKANCPISRLLAPGVDIGLTARLA
ncbi:MAG TPA: OsmC family peroxiredoxin [Micromonosporaceae bacterium]